MKHLVEADRIKRKTKSAANYFYTFIKWILIAGFTGLAGGATGSLFHLCVGWATGYRTEHGWILWFLPVGGIAIVGLYKLLKMPLTVGTDHVIHSVRSDEKVPAAMAPLIFISTVITHLLGGSAGREGAALQLGGSIGTQIGKLLKLDEKDMSLITLCGMSSVFSALFGTPLTAAIFSMEVISVGIFYYSGFVPCIVSALTAFGVSLLFGIEPVRFTLKAIPDISLPVIGKIGILAFLCAGVSILFCLSMQKTALFFRKVIKNEMILAAAGGLAVIALTFLVQTHDYNGAGMDVIIKAISNGEARPQDFILKILFTAVTIGAGFKGGEIVPTFFIGSTFGCFAGMLLGMDPGFCAAVGLIAIFCGVVNCPIASVFLSVELFGSEGLLLFAIASAVSFMLSGNYGIYKSQKIVYSKLKAEYINIHTK